MSYEPPFNKTTRIDELVLEIVELMGEFKASAVHDAKPWLHRKMRIKTIHSSLAIEGNTLAEDEVQEIIDGQRVLGNPKDILEVQNAIAAYEALDTFNPYSLDDLLRAHRLLMTGLVKGAGKLRSKNVGVFDGDVLIHAGTPPQYVATVMQDLFDWLASTDFHPLIASSIFHYEFEFIHPFEDGNGRCGRLWHTCLLASWRDMFAWLPIESAIFARQQDYYRALAACDAQGSSEVFVELMLEAIAESLRYWMRPAEKRTQQEMDALALFRNNPRATIQDLAGYLDVSPRTAARVVKNLRDAGQIHRAGSNKTGSWECNG